MASRIMVREMISSRLLPETIDDGVTIADFSGEYALPAIEVSVVMPCLNEERTVVVCVEKALQTMSRLGVMGEVVIADNGSTDKSVELATEAGARVVHQSQKGYGSALQKGFEEARGKFIIMGDCDDSYDFTDLERYIEELRGGADLVMGNRLKGEIKPGAMPPLHRYFGNPVLSGFLNLLFRTGVGDCHCGMRGFRKEAYQSLGCHMPGMEFASEMVIKASKARLKIREIPIVLSPDGRDRPPHLRSFRDGWRHLKLILMYSPSFLFLLPAVVMIALGLLAAPVALLAGYGTYETIFGPNFLIMAAFMAVAGAQIFFLGLIARLQAHRVDPVFASPRMDWLLRTFSVERGLISGGVISLIGLGLTIPVVSEWFRSGTVSQPALWILSGTLLVLGTQTMFGSFLIGILELQIERSKQKKL
ncbi:glycosyltransferase family 2 protein [Planctopirus limnophila]|nr:glycosyltransferase family 2 protein [Planctopirus limnophila]